MDDVQTFSGFPAEGLQLLKDLAHNNNRDWFEARKQAYQSYLLQPAQTFVAALGIKLQTISPAIHTNTRTDGTGVLMRIYRDTRFSADKSPYKTNISGLFWEGAAKKTESPAFGFQLEASGMGLMAGIFTFPPPFLAAYRAAVMDERLGLELEQALGTVREAGAYSLAGAHYKRVPSGYEVTHPRAELLRYNGLYASPPRLEPDQVTRPDLVEICFEHFQKMAPIQQWLVKVGQRVAA
jgi:uncharacterized protein (TIGR02453 family)